MAGPFLMIVALFACGPGDLVEQPPVEAIALSDIAAQTDTAIASDDTPPPANMAAAEDVPQPDLEAEIVVTARHRAPTSDPLEGVNVKTFAVAQALDGAVIRPTAMAYASVVPEPVRMGVRNFFRNLHEPVVFLNFLLQLKPGKAFKTLGRFAVNSTVGVGGLVDMAKKKPFGLPYRPNGFANTLAYYGVKPGAFLFLPLIGPTTVRDLAGLGFDTMTMPVSGLQPITGATYTASATAFKAIDGRAEGDERLHNLIDKNPNAYASIREAYMARRQAEVDDLRGVSRLAQNDAAPAMGVGPSTAGQLAK